MIRSDVTNQIIDYFKEKITSKEWVAGNKIPSENELRIDLGVSRASIRTAIQYFVGLGIMESVQGKGTYLLDANIPVHSDNSNRLTTDDFDDIQKVLEFRKIVEPEACYLATTHCNEQLIQSLTDYLGLMKKHQNNVKLFVDADINFHKEICRASQNPLLAKSMNLVFEETKNRHQQMNELFGSEDGIYYHTKLIEVIKNGNAAEARNLMHEHLEHGVKRLIT